MRKVCIDLNIILDFLGKRPNHHQAARMWDLCATKKVQGYICAHEVITLAYFLFKELKDDHKVRMIITELLDIFSIIPVTETVIRNALGSSVKDFEDAVVEVSSLEQEVQYIITGNLVDYKRSRVPAVSPDQFLYEISHQ